MGSQIRVYRNEDLQRVVAFIPRGHLHVRLLLEFSDGLRIVLQEASVSAITRAFLDVVLHPRRRAVELVLSRVDEGRKPGYARYQLIESGRAEEEVLSYVEEVLGEEVEKGVG